MISDSFGSPSTSRASLSRQPVPAPFVPEYRPRVRFRSGPPTPPPSITRAYLPGHYPPSRRFSFASHINITNKNEKDFGNSNSSSKNSNGNSNSNSISNSISNSDDSPPTSRTSHFDFSNTHACGFPNDRGCDPIVPFRHDAYTDPDDISVPSTGWNPHPTYGAPDFSDIESSMATRRETAGDRQRQRPTLQHLVCSSGIAAALSGGGSRLWRAGTRGWGRTERQPDRHVIKKRRWRGGPAKSGDAASAHAAVLQQRRRADLLKKRRRKKLCKGRGTLAVQRRGTHHPVLIFFSGFVLAAVFNIVALLLLWRWRGDERGRAFYVFGTIFGALLSFTIIGVAVVFTRAP